MLERSNRISRLLASLDSRTSYIRAKLSVLVPSQIRALRIKSNMPRQQDLADEAGMHQSRISMFETPGAANLTLDTLGRLAAAFRVGLVVKFVPFSEMLRWENEYNQDAFDVIRLNEDAEFLHPSKAIPVRKRRGRQRRSRQLKSNADTLFQVAVAGGRPNLHLSSSQANKQMQLPFENLAPPVAAANVIMLNRRIGSGYARNIQTTAVGIGAHYGNR